MSTQGPPADAKQAQAAALHEVEAAQRRKRALDVNLVSVLASGSWMVDGRTSAPLGGFSAQSAQRSHQANIEATIWAQESSYLEETAASGGNIIKVGGCERGRRGG